ncbi:hypothetical protein [Alkalihalobacillus sp. BA299]|uniref:hypothetical protein n=1 Tax=Alkalihalobacillus sp. BA299 TaxID=2815938 RepID=UPI001ADB6788|nr:hypothetical protein [Alkalihalobacillus sp. BA299]
MSQVNENNRINDPDLTFVNYCIEKYKINRGVYNTIDTWFFNNGERNILRRRKMIILFLSSLYLPQKRFMSFGKGGLTEKLNYFWYKQDESVL